MSNYKDKRICPKSKPYSVLFSVGFSLIPDAWVTIQEALLGFLLAIITGFSIAILIVWSEPIKRAILPLLVFIQTMPKIAIAQLFISWFGFGVLLKVIFKLH